MTLSSGISNTIQPCVFWPVSSVWVRAVRGQWRALAASVGLPLRDTTGL